MVGREMNQLSVETEYRAPDRCAEARRVGRDGLEHRLRVRRRARDDLEDLTGGRQVSIACLQFGEEPHVLDRDDRLVGEGLEQLDLTGRERSSLASHHL